MDEYNSGMDPEVIKYFKKIINSFTVGILWLVTISTAGIYFELGIIKHGLHWYNILFYIFTIISLGYLFYYYSKVWKN
jgi:hypothetical protein